MTYIYRKPLEKMTIAEKILYLYEIELKTEPEFYKQEIASYYTPSTAMDMLLGNCGINLPFSDMVNADLIAEIEYDVNLLPVYILIDLHKKYRADTPELIEELREKAECYLRFKEVMEDPIYTIYSNGVVEIDYSDGVYRIWKGEQQLRYTTRSMAIAFKIFDSIEESQGL